MLDHDLMFSQIKIFQLSDKISHIQIILIEIKIKLCRDLF